MNTILQDEYNKYLEIYKENIDSDMVEDAILKFLKETTGETELKEDIGSEVLINTSAFAFSFILFLENLTFQDFVEKHKINNTEGLKFAINLFSELLVYLTPEEYRI
jgi:hypothetical protein